MTSLLAWAAVGALLLIAARFVLPVMGLAGVEGELVQPLIRLMPLSILLLVGAVLAIVLDLRRQGRLVDAGIARLTNADERWKEEVVAEMKTQPGLYRFTGRAPAAAASVAPELATVAVASPALAHATAVVKLPDLTGAHLEASLSAAQLTLATDEAAFASNGEALPDEQSFDATTDALDSDPMLNAAAAQNESEGAPSPGEPRFGGFAQAAFEAVTAPAQLPPPVSEFAGRELELQTLQAARADHHALSLQGAGGVGKTTLALALAHQFATDYPDGQFYLDLKGVSARPLTTAEAQAHVIRAYLPTVRLPESDEELDHLYHALLADKRALLLLDNAAASQQIAPLIAPAGCLTIITSRQYLSLPGLFIAQIEGLPATEANELLLRLAPRVGDDAASLAALCGRVPLALRLAASALLLNPQLKVADYAAQLEALQRGERALKSVEAALEISYELLPVGLPSMWRMLSIFSDTFDANAAAAIWRAHPSRASAGLDHLTAYSLVERNAATGRFRLHDLMAAFADGHLAEAEREAARQLHASHYQSVLHEADALYEQGGEMLRLGLELVDREWHNIHAGQTWAALHKDHNRTACELCSSYPDAGKFVLDLRQHPRERIRWSEIALASAQRLNRRKAAARHLIELGDSYADLSEARHALELYEQALLLARETGDKRAEAEALRGVGASHYLNGDLENARELHEAALDAYAAIDDRRGQARSLCNLGWAHHALGQFAQAQMLFDQALKAAQEIGDRRGEAAALGGLGATLHARGDWRRAAATISLQLEIARELGDRRGETTALSQLGAAYACLGFHPQAIAFHEQALTVARAAGDRRGEAAALGGLGAAEYLARNPRRAADLFDAQLKLAREIGDVRGEAQAIAGRGETCLAMGDAQRAMALLQQAITFFQSIGDVYGQATALFNQALAADALGQRRTAFHKAKSALTMFEGTGGRGIEMARRQLIAWGA